MALIFTISLIIATNYAQQWISSSSTVIRKDAMMASGFTNGSIFIIGGFAYPEQVTEYDISKDIFIDHGEFVLPHNGIQWQYSDSGQWYTQQQNTIYMIDPSGTSFDIYHMNYMGTQIFQRNWMNITLNTTVSASGCLASSEDYLFVTGGGVSIIQMLDLNTLLWVTGVQNMQTSRSYHSCVVDSVRNDIYNIGGGNSMATVRSVEKVLITSITQKSGIFIGNLTEVVRGMRSVFYKNNIIVIGGLDVNARPVNVVHIISTGSTGTIIALTNILVNTVRHPSIILVDSTIFSFGGDAVIDNQLTATNILEYYQIETNAPIKSPTKSPIMDSADSPTKSPSVSPIDEQESMEKIEKEDSSLPDVWVWVIIGIGLCLCIVTVLCFSMSTNNESNTHVVTMILSNIHQKHKTNTCHEPKETRKETGNMETHNVEEDSNVNVEAEIEGKSWMFANTNK